MHIDYVSRRVLKRARDSVWNIYETFTLRIEKHPKFHFIFQPKFSNYPIPAPHHLPLSPFPTHYSEQVRAPMGSSHSLAIKLGQDLAPPLCIKSEYGIPS